MATKKKAKKRQPKPKGAKKPAKKLSTVNRSSSPRKSAKKKAVGKTKSISRKSLVPRKTASKLERARSNSQTVRTVTFPRESGGGLSGRQSGDMQGLSNTEGADSQSVDELLEEGNTFEADVVKGVEEAGSADEAEVRTREVPEDDVPGEYLDKDQ